jgi:hypothetical protein
MDIRVGTGETNVLTVHLQWNDPWGGAVADFNMRLWNNDLSSQIASATAVQTGSDPIETLNWTNSSGQAVTVKLLVEGLGGETSTFEMFLMGNGFLGAEYVDGAGSIIGHGAVPGVITVGSVDAAAPDVIELFSSQGPSRVGTPTLSDRYKPDLVAVDNVTVSGTGGFGSLFSGTSAAAPHVAGIAALLLSADPMATTNQIRNSMISSAADLGTAGRDDIYGYGRVDAQAAYNELTSPSGGGGAGGGCFIATALYGSIDDPNVLLLRRFRDEILAKGPPGRAFIDAYYRHSPPIALWLEANDWARPLGRAFLLPLVFMAWFVLNPWLLASVMVLVLVSARLRGSSC